MVRGVLQAAATAVFPPQCAVCGTGSTALCGRCWAGLRPAPALSPLPGVDWCGALLAYEGGGRTLLARLKYRNERSALAWLAAGMALVVRAAPDAGAGSVVTWVPTSAARRRARGFDQAELLARAVARALDLPCGPRLARAPGPAQTGRSRSQRLDGPTFWVGEQRAPPSVLVVDDVLTTGATVSAAASALRAAGVQRVDVVTAATTLLKNSPGRVDP